MKGTVEKAAMTTWVLMAGLPGTGKSTLAQALARELGGAVLNKDTVRAALFPGDLTDFTREQDNLCFRAVLQGAAYLAQHERVKYVFLDGRTFSRRTQIDEAIQAAEAAGCAWHILHTICPDAIAEARLLADKASHPAANRTVEMYREIRARFEPIIYRSLEVDTSQPLECSTQRILFLLNARK